LFVSADDDLTARVLALEGALARLRTAIAVLTRRVRIGEIDDLIADWADRVMSEDEMEAAFARLDTALDAKL
jgi:hypothetical protein